MSNEEKEEKPSFLEQVASFSQVAESAIRKLRTTFSYEEPRLENLVDSSLVNGFSLETFEGVVKGYLEQTTPGEGCPLKRNAPKWLSFLSWRNCQGHTSAHHGNLSCH